MLSVLSFISSSEWIVTAIGSRIPVADSQISRPIDLKTEQKTLIQHCGIRAKLRT